MAQLALYETEMVEMPQVFLPFATDAKGRRSMTLCRQIRSFCEGRDRRSMQQKDPALEDVMSRGEPFYATIQNTMDSAPCLRVHADWLSVLESLSATSNKCGGKAYRTWLCRMKKTGELELSLQKCGV